MDKSARSQRTYSVRFNNIVQVYEIQRWLNLTGGDATLIWYSPFELECSQPNCRNVRRRSFSSSSAICTEDDCARGLEFFATKGSCLRQRDCKLAKFAVADEQDMQRRQYGRLYDLDALADAYHQHTKHCQDEAHVMALVDELYVRKHVYNLPCPSILHNAQRTVSFSDKMRLCTCCGGGIRRGENKRMVVSSLSLSPRPRRQSASNDAFSSVPSHPRKSRSDSSLVNATQDARKSVISKKNFLQRIASIANNKELQQMC